jgi:Zn-dependent hydrolases, including glyoxylases
MVVMVLIMGGVILILSNGTKYTTKSFNRGILSTDLTSQKDSYNKKLLCASSKVDVEYIHSGNLKVKLSNPINLKHPACKGMKDEYVTIPIFTYLLKHEEYGYFLIDSGCAASYAENPYGPMKGLLFPLVMPETELKSEEAIENQLPGEVLSKIKAVFFTHLHFDHTSGLPALSGSPLYIAGKGEKSYSFKWLLEPNHFKKDDTVYMLDFDTELAETFPLGKAIDIFNDQTVWAISTPGHSKGHVSYLINSKNGPVLIAGDACIMNISLQQGVGSGTSSADKKQDQKTLDKIRTFVKENPEVKVWYGHDFPVK